LGSDEGFDDAGGFDHERAAGEAADDGRGTARIRRVQNRDCISIVDNGSGLPTQELDYRAISESNNSRNKLHTRRPVRNSQGGIMTNGSDDGLPTQELDYEQISRENDSRYRHR
jgi:hypothetical protein